MPIFEFMYMPDQRDISAFGEHYRPPERFGHGEWHVVAEYPAKEGVAVTVSECRLPARFFKIEFPGFEMTTGSGQEAFAAQIAEDLANSMLSVRAVAEAQK